MSNLTGSRCESCGDVSFPKVNRCKNPACGGEALDETDLAGDGRLVGFTIQHYKPPPPFVAPEPFAPFAIGLIELPIGISVLGQVDVDNVAAVAVGMTARLVDNSPALGWRIKLEG